MNKKLKTLIVVVFAGVMVLGGVNVMALDAKKSGQMMTISPPRERMILIPGETYEGTISVSNSSNAERDLKYSAHVGSFSLREDEDGKTDYNNTDVDTVTSYNQVMEWITLGKESGSVAPGSADVLSYTIKVPENAPAGGQYASIIIRNDTKKDNEDSGNVMVENVVEFAVSILAEVAGETEEKGAIIENSIPAFLLNNTLNAGSIVRNDGNVHTDAEYVLQVWPLFSDEEICTNEEEPATSMIMPDSERYHSETCNLPSFGLFRAKQTVKIFGETSIVEKTIIACPLWLLFVIIFVIVALIIWIVIKTKDRKKRRSRYSDE